MLEIPSYEVKVEASKAAVLPNNETEKSAVVQTNIKQKESLLPDVTDKKEDVKSLEWWMLMLAFILGLFMMYLFKYVPLSTFKTEKSAYKESEALKILYAHITESKEIEEMVRKLYAKERGDKSVVIDKKLLKELVEKIKGDF